MKTARALLLPLLTCALLACEEGPPPDPALWTGDHPAADAPAPTSPPAISPAEPSAVDAVGAVDLVDDTPLTLAVAEVTAVAARVVDERGRSVDAPVTWHSDDPLVAWVDPTGAVLGVGIGRTTIHARAGSAPSAPLAVRVEPAAGQGPSYAEAIDPILRAGCALSGCHVDGVEPGDLRFDRDVDRMWEELVDDRAEQTGRPRVASGDPGGSYLIEKLLLARPAVGARMPLGRAPLPIGELQAIVAWIAHGAPR